MFKLSKLDFIVIIIIIGIIVVVGIYSMTENKKQEVAKKFDFSVVDQYNTYFMVEEKINDFLMNSSEKNYDYIYNILDKEYINKYSVNMSNISTYVPNYDLEVGINIDEMKLLQMQNNYIYYTKAKIVQGGYDEDISIVDDNFNILMFLDIDHMTYSFYPLNNEDYMDVVYNISKINIDQNNSNKYTGASMISTESICALYLSNYNNMLYNDIEKSYEILAPNIKYNSFKSIDEYKEYINKNIDKFSSVATKCTLLGEETRTYLVFDSNDNSYTFTENAIMDYTVSFSLK